MTTSQGAGESAVKRSHSFTISVRLCSSSGSGVSDSANSPLSIRPRAEASGPLSSPSSDFAAGALSSSLILLLPRLFRRCPQRQKTIQSMHRGKVRTFLERALAEELRLPSFPSPNSLPSARASSLSCLFTMYSKVVSCWDMRKRCSKTSCKSSKNSGTFTTTSVMVRPSSSSCGEFLKRTIDCALRTNLSSSVTYVRSTYAQVQRRMPVITATEHTVAKKAR
mmetsp:Transcript_118308/g.346583  ORF Transcript_118308/g.346583 Transcript_118308/m.346583 type:complete len:223 (-) Transcript_118308:455-1123(-)